MNSESSMGGSGKKQEIVVFAAASLTESFLEIKKDYELINPEVEIVLNFAGSQVLKNQIISGAKPGMYFSANMKYPLELIESQKTQGLELIPNTTLTEEDIRVFAENELVIISPLKEDCHTIQEVFTKVLDENSLIVLAHEDVPVGKYTNLFLSAYRDITGDVEGYKSFCNQVVSYENDVKAVLAKVKMKEVDFGVVYRTDALSASADLISISIPKEYNQIGIYGSLLLSEEDEVLKLFDYILEGEGQTTLGEFGFSHK